MKKSKVFILTLVVAFLAAACSPEGVQPLNQTDAGTGSGAGGETEGQAAQGGDQSGIQSLVGGTPGVIIPDPGEGNISSGEGSGGAISSSGEQSSGGAISNQPGSTGSSSSGSGSSSTGANRPPNFIVFENEEFHFSISYPDVYVILPEIELLSQVEPGLVYRVRFQDKQLATGDTANLELPQFTIEVYDTPDREALEAFIDAKAPEGGQREAVEINGLKGYRVVLQTLMAPNTFYYFAAGGYIYKLTPLGKYSPDMLETFKVE